MPTSKYRSRKGKVSTRYIRPFDPWSNPLCTCPFKYSLNPYTGCSHFCIYCYATAYVGRRPSMPKKDIVKKVSKELAKIDKRVIINMSTSSDPYPPLERELGITRRLLNIMLPQGFKILVTTKGDTVARDADILSRGNAAVTITITTLDTTLASKIEPGAPPPRYRLAALAKLRESGVPVGVRLDPILPYLNDEPTEIRELVGAIAEAGATFIVTSTYKARPDSLSRILEVFPELKEKYGKLYRAEGEWISGYWYLPRKIRIRLLEPVFDAARRYKLEYAHCREGLTGKQYFNARSCDGSHLIPERIKVNLIDRNI